MTEPKLFTPWDKRKVERLKFKREDVHVICGDMGVRREGLNAVVRIKNQVYAVYGMACSLPNCMCDAYIKPIEINNSGKLK